MGNCRSSDSSQVATAKVVLHDGRLQEFPYPVKVSFLLQKYPTFFICNSDEMDFDDAVSAVHEDHLLQLGQLYFALPLSRLGHPLQPHEMAALAVKASSALMKTAHRCRKQNILFPINDHDPTSKRVSPALSDAARTAARKGRFAALLTSIPE
ncbi:hypothetical protein Fmac_002452 [Flemingia macrophylla]|uniref:Uncharacterized protein n=1 Tax=Flemingia macrophylla TaxID=520843 RepID=A0ABD1NLB8_9FABA